MTEETEAKKKLLEDARKRMSSCVDADEDNREAALGDLQMLSGVGHWPESVKSQREAEDRPCHVINRLPRFVRQVTGDIRKLNPAIKVIPEDAEANDDGAELIEGLIRKIEYDSRATAIYEGAAENAAQCGIGAFRVLTEFESDSSFDQVIRLKRIANPLSVYFDPNSREPDRSDAEFAFITDQISNEDYKEMFGKDAEGDFEHDGVTDGLEDWQSEGKVTIAEYYWKEPVTKTIGLREDGSVVEGPSKGDEVKKTRKVKSHKVMWAKLSGMRVIDGPREIPCEYIPVVAVVGEELHIGNRIVRTSVIRHAKDPQQIYNYYASAQAEVIALQPKAPYLVTTKQVKGLEKFWKEAGKANRPYLPYNPDDKAGMPQRAQPPVVSSAMLQEMSRAEDDMKATTGIYDAALGGRSNEQSGVAIRQRQLESDISTSIYTDNLAKAIEHAGRIIVSMIPNVYDTARNVRTVNEDEKEEMIPINGVIVSEGRPIKVNPVTEGRYNVRVTVGPNYTTRRQETAESMMQFVQSFPAAGQVAGDLIAKSMDWPDADKLATRLEKILPPGMISPEDMDPEQQQAMAQKQRAAQAEQQQAMQVQQQAQKLEFRKADAEATEAEADAQKAQTEAASQQLQLAIESGQLNDAIGQIVQAQVAQVLQGMMQRA